MNSTDATPAAPLDALAAHAAARPDAPALIVDDGSSPDAVVTSFAELNRRVNRIANGLLAAGVRAGERIVWCGPNSPEVIAIIHAARKLSLVAVPLSYRFNPEEMSYVIDNSEAVAVLADAQYAPVADAARTANGNVRIFAAFAGDAPQGWIHLDAIEAAGQESEPPAAADPASGGAQMIYTSGTTGKPKGALRTRSDRDLVAALLTELGMFHPDPVHLTTGPLYHSGPLAFASLAHTLGAPIVLMRTFDAGLWLRLVARHRVTNTFCAPTQLKRIVSLPAAQLAQADVSSMVTLIANAAPVPYALKVEIIGKLGDGFLYEVYGSTELGVDTVLKPQDQLRKPGSCGKPYGSIELRVVRDDGAPAAAGEPGELFVRTGLAMDGYHRTEEQLTELDQGGWKSVGDVAYIDDEGYVHICDRKKDMIISGGVNIYPAEIEAVLHGHPAVIDVAVFGVPDEEWGESVHAVVQPKADQTIDLDDLRAFAAERLASYKRPRSWEVRDELPRTDSGKLLKRVLRDEFWHGHDRRV